MFSYTAYFEITQIFNLFIYGFAVIILLYLNTYSPLSVHVSNIMLLNETLLQSIMPTHTHKNIIMCHSFFVKQFVAPSALAVNHHIHKLVN